MRIWAGLELSEKIPQIPPNLPQDFPSKKSIRIHRRKLQVTAPKAIFYQARTFQNKMKQFLWRGVFTVLYTRKVWKNGPKSGEKSGLKMGILFFVMVCFGPFARRFFGTFIRRKLKRATTKGQNRCTLFHTFRHFSTPFSRFFLQDFFLELRGFTSVLVQRDEKRIKDNKKKKTKPFCTLVVARLSSSYLCRAGASGLCR